MTRRSKAPGRWVGLAVLAVGVLGCGDPAGSPRDGAGHDTASKQAEASGSPSGLWGYHGELWSPAGRLPDFSHAGYRQGEVALPEVPTVVDVRDFGAVGDGVHDDTDAFVAALAAVDRGAVFVPAGRYRLTRILHLRSHVVLRGEARDATVLFFPHSLYEVYGKGTIGGPYGWSWGGGWIDARGTFGGELLTPIVAPALRGDSSLRVATTRGLRVGQWVRLVQTETGGLSSHVHAGFPLDGRCAIDRPGMKIVDWAVKIVRLERRRVFFDRPLRVDVRLPWQPEVWSFEPTLVETGVEHLTVAFPETPQQPHHDEYGYNAFHFEHTFDSWLRDVAIVNADNGIHAWYSRFCTFQQILTAGRGGHYTVNLGGTQDCLLREFRFETVSHHDVSFSNLGNGSVVARGAAPWLNSDHHRGAAYENLVSDVRVGAAWNHSRLWACSHTASGHYTAARETYWNLRPRASLRWLPPFPELNLIGSLQGSNVFRRRLRAWVEHVEALTPRDLHHAQVTRRLGRTPPALSTRALRVRVPDRTPGAAAPDGMHDRSP